MKKLLEFHIRVKRPQDEHYAGICFFARCVDIDIQDGKKIAFTWDETLGNDPEFVFVADFQEVLFVTGHPECMQRVYCSLHSSDPNDDDGLLHNIECLRQISAYIQEIFGDKILIETEDVEYCNDRTGARFRPLSEFNVDAFWNEET